MNDEKFQYQILNEINKLRKGQEVFIKEQAMFHGKHEERSKDIKEDIKNINNRFERLECSEHSKQITKNKNSIWWIMGIGGTVISAVGLILYGMLT